MKKFITRRPLASLLVFFFLLVHASIFSQSNTPPLAVRDSINVMINQFGIGNVLSNDSDAENNQLTTSLVTAPVNGTVVLNSNGSFTYTPNLNYNGLDSLIYQVCDNGTPSLCDTATLVFRVAPNSPPVALHDYISLPENNIQAGNVLLNDTDIDRNALTASLVTAPVNGTVVLNADGSFTYNPNANFNGVDSLHYQVCDNGTPSLCDTATLYMTVIPLNNRPIAIDDRTSVQEDLPATGNVLTNDSDTEGDPLTASLVTAPVNGTVVLNADGSFTYTPNANYSGEDSLIYQVCDNGAPSLCDTAKLYFSINAVNDSPVNTVPGEQTIGQDKHRVFYLANGNLIAVNDIDAGNGIISVSLTATNGRITLSTASGLQFTEGSSANEASMSFRGVIAAINAALDGLLFRPNAGFSGNASITIVSNDLGLTGSGGARTDTDIIQIKVTDTNAPAVTIQSTAPNPINQAFQLAIVFSEPVTGFTEEDMVLQNATVSAVSTTNNITYTALMTPQVSGTVSISIPAGVVTDGAGNNNTASNVLTRTYDITPPKASVSTPASSRNPSFTAYFNFNKPVSGFELPDLRITNGKATTLVQHSPVRYSVQVVPEYTGAVNIRLEAGKVTDALGNVNDVAVSATTEVLFSAKINKVFPVPANQQLNISFKGVISGKMQVKLVSMSGIVMHDAAYDHRDNLVTIDVSNLPAGAYFLYCKSLIVMQRRLILISR